MDIKAKSILIIEDDQFLREFYEELLTGEGFQISSAADGDVGLQKLQQGGWNLVLLDIMLPKKDGLQILRDLKAAPAKFANGPIVVLTNLGNDTIINQAFELGANGYLIKSAMNPDEVLTEIHSYLNGTNSQTPPKQ